MSESWDFVVEVGEIVGDLPYSFHRVSGVDELERINLSTFGPSLLVIDLPPDRKALTYAYDVAWKKFKLSKVIVLFDGQLPFDYDELGTRRLNMVFVHRSFEMDTLLDHFLDFAPIEIPQECLELKHLLPVRLSDILPDETLQFDLYIYLPTNKKIILYRRQNSTVTSAQHKKFSDLKIHDLYIKRTDAKLFNNFVTKKLKSIFSDGKIPETERRQRLQRKVRDIFADFFDAGTVDPKRNRVILNTCKQIVGEFITSVSPHPEVFQQILFYTAQYQSRYNNAVNTSVFASLFALCLGVEEVESMAIGGLLHKIGLASLPPQVTKKKKEQMTPQELAVYQTFPAEGIKLLKNKKIGGAEAIYKLIEQHQENVDGTGFPRKLQGDQIDILARLCRIASEFDELTSVAIPGAVPLTPAAALERLSQNGQLDQTLLDKLKDVLEKPEENVIDLQKARGQFEGPAEAPKSGPNDDDLTRKRRYKKPSS